jgi:hypothetical protein
MVKIAISQEAFDAIAVVMPVESVGFAQTNERGERLIWLPRGVVAKQIGWDIEKMHRSWESGFAAAETTEVAASGRQSQSAPRSEELSAVSTVAGRTEMAGPGRVESIERPGEPG